MSNTRKKYHGKKYKTQRKSRASRVAAATMEQIKQNRMRNKMVRNIRMGRVHQGGGGQMAGGGFMSQFIGKPWTPDSLRGNFFSLSPKGVGTGHVPTFDDGRPLYSARFPTQLGPQVPKLGQAGGSYRRSRKNIRGGGVLDGATYLVNNFNATLQGTSRPPNPDPHVQPFLKTSCSI
jgi:hypothetical protein